MGSGGRSCRKYLPSIFGVFQPHYSRIWNLFHPRKNDLSIKESASLWITAKSSMSSLPRSTCFHVFILAYCHWGWMDNCPQQRCSSTACSHQSVVPVPNAIVYLSQHCMFLGSLWRVLREAMVQLRECNHTANGHILYWRWTHLPATTHTGFIRPKEARSAVI